jgi:hypothetical protein
MDSALLAEACSASITREYSFLGLQILFLLKVITIAVWEIFTVFDLRVARRVPKGPPGV